MLKDLWQKTVENFKDEKPKEYPLYMKHIGFLNANRDILTLSVPNELVKEIVSNKYKSYFTKYISSLAQKDIKINFEVVQKTLSNPESQSQETSQDSSLSETSTDEEIQVSEGNSKDVSGYSDVGESGRRGKNLELFRYLPPSEKDLRKEKQGGTPMLGTLNPRNTFQNYVVGENNQLAYAVARRISAAPGIEYNPCFIYGGVGLGKTHLMQAIGHNIHNGFPMHKIVYVQCEQFVNDYVESIAQKRFHQFRLKYRSADLLLIDDVQFLDNKNKTQQELFNIFNVMKDSGKQMVFTSDRSPLELTNLHDRLISRFTSGLTAEIKQPDITTRKEILKRKLHDYKIKLTEDIVEYVAERISNNVRDLEASVLKLKFLTDMQFTGISLKTINEHLKELFSTNYSRNRKLITVDSILEEVASYFNVKSAEIKGARKLSSITKPRQIAMYLTKKLTPLSLIEIGSAFGGKRHTTVMYAYNKIDKEMKKNNSIKNDVDTLIKKIAP